MQLKSNLDATQMQDRCNSDVIGTSAWHSSWSPLRRSTGTTIVDRFFHYSFLFLPLLLFFSPPQPFLIEGALRSKNLLQQKFTGAPTSSILAAILDSAGNPVLHVVSESPLHRQASIYKYSLAGSKTCSLLFHGWCKRKENKAILASNFKFKFKLKLSLASFKNGQEIHKVYFGKTI